SWDMDRIGLVEQFKVLLLNRACHPIAIYEVSTGGTSSTVVDIKLVMVAALKANAHRLIVCHNHPSGNLTASDQDAELTKKLLEASSLLDLQLLDHLILTPHAYFSFADEGLVI